MLKCPVCGNSLLESDAKNGEIRCPVAGCGAVVRPDELRSRTRLWSKPKGGSFGWASGGSGKAEAEEGMPLRMQTFEDREMHVCGLKGDAPQTLIVPESWKGMPVTRIEAYALANQRKIKRIVLPDSLQSIGHDAFADCSALETVKFGKNLKLVDAFAFKNCTLLHRLEFEEAPLCVMDTAFAGCLSLDDAERVRFQGE